MHHINPTGVAPSKEAATVLSTHLHRGMVPCDLHLFKLHLGPRGPVYTTFREIPNSNWQPWEALGGVDQRREGVDAGAFQSPENLQALFR